MKKTAGFFLTLLCLIPAARPARAALDALDYRRTLFVPVQRHMLVFEAPKGMCFIDPTTDVTAEQVYDDTERTINNSHNESLLAVFAPCLDIAASTRGEKPLSTLGFITWLNPSVGATTTLDRANYLAQQKNSFKDHIKKTLSRFGRHQKPEKHALMLLAPTEDYQIDKDAHLSNNAVSVGYTNAFEYEYDKYNTGGVSATTVLRSIPIAVTLRQTNNLPPDMTMLYKLADAFLEQQIALNP